AQEKGQRTPELRAIDEWLERRLADELANSALREKDPELARRLMQTPGAVADVKTRTELNRLAMSGELARRIVGRTLGLVLSLESPTGQVRSSELASGVMRALKLPASARDPRAVRLLVENDRIGMRTALGKLAGGGASILIAGVDAEGAAEATAFAEEAAIPVLIVTAGATATRDPKYSFSIGVEKSTQQALLAKA